MDERTKTRPLMRNRGRRPIGQSGRPITESRNAHAPGSLRPVVRPRGSSTSLRCSSCHRPGILPGPGLARSGEIGNAQRDGIRLGTRARLPGGAQDRPQVFIKTLELSCIGRQSLEIERPLENRPRNMKALKPAPHANLKDHSIAVVRHSCPDKRIAVHEASEESQSSHQYASRIARCISIFQNVVPLGASVFSRRREYRDATNS
ncbi:hypothetical protein EMIT0111MI5_80271 [Burkholderia sp. IT-111MI5]